MSIGYLQPLVIICPQACPQVSLFRTISHFIFLVVLFTSSLFSEFNIRSKSFITLKSSDYISFICHCVCVFFFLFLHSQLCILVLTFSPINIKWYRGIKTTCQPVDTSFPNWEHYRNHLSSKPEKHNNPTHNVLHTRRKCLRLANNSIY